MKLDKNMLIIGGIVLVGIIIVMGSSGHIPVIHELLHMNDTPRDTPPDITDRDAMYAGYY